MKCNHKPPTILRYRALKNYPHLRVFNMMLYGYIINGFVYHPEAGSIMPPTGHKNQPVVHAHGIHWKRLRERLEEEEVKWQAKS